MVDTCGVEGWVLRGGEGGERVRGYVRGWECGSGSGRVREWEGWEGWESGRVGGARGWDGGF